jgi:hypothetical protein
MYIYHHICLVSKIKTYVMIDVQVNLYFNFRHKTYVMIHVQVNLHFNFKQNLHVHVSSQMSYV